jgi:hypothetical protein
MGNISIKRHWKVLPIVLTLFTKIGVFHGLFGIKWTLCWRAVNRIYMILALASAFRPREVFIYSLSKFHADNVTDFLLN